MAKKKKKLDITDCRKMFITVPVYCTFDPQREGQQLMHMTIADCCTEIHTEGEEKRIGYTRGCLGGAMEAGIDEPHETWTMRPMDLWRAMMAGRNVITKQPTLDELRAMVDEDGYVKAVVPVDLGGFGGLTLDPLNDLVSELLTGSECGLTDISYNAVGAIPGDGHGTLNGEVLLEVTAHVEFDFLEDDEEDDG